MVAPQAHLAQRGLDDNLGCGSGARRSGFFLAGMSKRVSDMAGPLSTRRVGRGFWKWGLRWGGAGRCFLLGTSGLIF